MKNDKKYELSTDKFFNHAKQERKKDRTHTRKPKRLRFPLGSLRLHSSTG